MMTDAGSARAIAEGSHHDPFSFLGMHQEGSGLVVRTFQPQAAAVGLIDGRTDRLTASFERVHDSGLFMARVEESSAFPYRLRISVGDREDEAEDPYRFPPVLGALDLH